MFVCVCIYIYIYVTYMHAVCVCALAVVLVRVSKQVKVREVRFTDLCIRDCGASPGDQIQMSQNAPYVTSLR